jgi:hypothetical protein
MSVIRDFQVNGLNPSTVGGVGTAAKYFPRILGSSIGNFSAAPSATSAAGQLDVPAFGELQGQVFKVVLGGDVLPFTGGGNVTIDLVANTGTIASPTYAAIASTGAVTLASATPVNWSIEATLVGTNNSGATPGLLSGYFIASLNNAAVIGPSPITNPPSGLDFVKGQPAPTQGNVVGLVARVTFSVSLAQNFARLYQFQAYGA